MNSLALCRGRVSATALILVAAVAAGLGLWLGLGRHGAPTAPTFVAATAYPLPRALPDFTLNRADGKPLTRADWQGHWTVAFFGFTNCPDICPTTLGAFREVWKRLDPATRSKVRFDFVSVDPARDTPDQLARYVAFYDPSFVASTGRDEELTRLTRALGLVYARGEPKDGMYSVDHSASAVLIDPEARQVAIFRPPFDVAKIAADLTAVASQR